MSGRTHSANLRASAQLVTILGRELINENAVGLIELVKNAYDADATRVDVKLDQLHDPAQTRIIVHDNGFGMTVDDVLDRWMVAGYSAKAAAKQRQERTPKGRLPQGQMGIGRFATARIGKKLMVVTKTKDGPEVYFEIHWSAFEQGGDVGDVDIVVTERDPQVFSKGQSGTRVAMLGAPEPWTERDVQALHRKLLRLISPMHRIDDFDIALSCPEYPELERLVPQSVLDNFHFKLTAQVDAEGKASILWEDKLAKLDGAEEIDLWGKLPRAFHALNKRTAPACGPFEIDVRGWRLRKPELTIVGIKDRKAVEELSGISVFRDGFRLLPYGEYGNDWLELNKRRVNNPTERFSTNQLNGLVHVSTELNPDLLDQANRLGLQQNAAFVDLRELVVAAVGVLEDHTIRAEVAKRAEERRREAEARVAARREASQSGSPRGDSAAGASLAPRLEQVSGPTFHPPLRPSDLRASRSTTVQSLRAVLSTIQSLRTVNQYEEEIGGSLKRAADSIQDALTTLEDEDAVSA